VNDALLQFFGDNHAPGRIGLIGATDVIGRLVRAGESGMTSDGKPSRWSHSFVLGERRADGQLYIYESDLRVSVTDWQVQNGAMESRLAKWCRDDIEHACVLGMGLTADESAALLRKALGYAYDEQHLRYPVGELFGTIWATLTRRLDKKNVFDDKYAVQCATFVRMCYRDIGRDPLGTVVDLTNTSPEAFYRSDAFSFRNEWHR